MRSEHLCAARRQSAGPNHPGLADQIHLQGVHRKGSSRPTSRHHRARGHSRGPSIFSPLAAPSCQRQAAVIMREGRRGRLFRGRYRLEQPVVGRLAVITARSPPNAPVPRLLAAWAVRESVAKAGWRCPLRGVRPTRSLGDGAAKRAIAVIALDRDAFFRPAPSSRLARRDPVQRQARPTQRGGEKQEHVLVMSEPSVELPFEPFPSRSVELFGEIERGCSLNPHEIAPLRKMEARACGRCPAVILADRLAAGGPLRRAARIEIPRDGRDELFRLTPEGAVPRAAQLACDRARQGRALVGAESCRRGAGFVGGGYELPLPDKEVVADPAAARSRSAALAAKGWVWAAGVRFRAANDPGGLAGRGAGGAPGLRRGRARSTRSAAPRSGAGGDHGQRRRNCGAAFRHRIGRGGLKAHFGRKAHCHAFRERQTTSVRPACNASTAPARQQRQRAARPIFSSGERRCLPLSSRLWR